MVHLHIWIGELKNHHVLIYLSVSPELFPLTNWKVLDDNMLSNHYLIEIEVKITLDTMPYNSQRFLNNQVSKKEWSEFRKSLELFDPNSILTT